MLTTNDARTRYHISSFARLALSTLLMVAFVAGPALNTPAARADSATVDFEAYTVGTVDNQDGWSSDGAAGSGCAVYDHQVAANTYGYASFGTKSLRISNAVTSGCFSDHTFSKSLADEAGETSAQNGGLSGGTRQTSFEAQWDFASTVPTAEQPGLVVVASPDRGDGARMSWVQMADTPTGLAVNFNDYQASAFVQTNVASGLDRSVPHTIKLKMTFADGPANDGVQIYVDGVLRHTGTSWEDYFRLVETTQTRTVDSILFRTGGVGSAVPANAGKGFLIDNLTLTSGVAPQCTTTCYVDAATGSDAFGGTDPSDAKKTIQAAVTQVSTGGTVIVAAGTYTENVTIAKDGITLQGAGIGTTVVQSPTSGAGAGIALSGSRSNITIRQLSVTQFQNGVEMFTGPLTNILLEDVAASGNAQHGIWSQAFSVNGLTLRRVQASNNDPAPCSASPGRGVWIINGAKQNITIADGVFSGNCLVGIDISDGSVSGLTISGNTVANNGDAGIGVLGAQGPGANLVDTNTVTNNGRFGIEVKNATGNGATSGAGSVVISHNTVTRSAAAADLRDHAGVAVFRRSPVLPDNPDQPSGVAVIANAVSGYHRAPSGATGDGFGIVVEGTGHVVANNSLADNDVGIQVQGGNPSINAQSTDFFDRGNAASGGALVNQNSVVGNAIGVRTVGGAAVTPLDATANWWGSVTGPAPAGGGDSAVNVADVDPWLCDGTDTSTDVGFQPNAAGVCGGGAPDTTITSTPSDPASSGAASFSFTGTDDVTPQGSLTFECSLDGAAFTACTSPASYSGLAEGSHTFQVRAKDQAGVVDPTPASFTWTVEISYMLYLPLIAN